MGNGETRSRPSSRLVSEAADLAAKGAQIYPTLLQAGITYWAKWLETGLGYYSTAARQWALAVREPDKRPEHVQSMIDELKVTLLSLAQVPGEAVLSLNQKVEELLREPGEDPARGAPEQALGQRIRRDLEQLGRSSAFRASARAAGVELPSSEDIAAALSKLESAQQDVLRARRDVHGAVETVLQASRKVSAARAGTEEPPEDVLRRLADNLERIAASVEQSK